MVRVGIVVGFILWCIGEVEGSRWGLVTEHLTLKRKGFQTVLLTDGRVLVIGGGSGNTTLAQDTTYTIFDPATGRWSDPKVIPQHDNLQRANHAMALLLYNGLVLFVPRVAKQFLLYDPTTDNWRASLVDDWAWNWRGPYTLLRNGNVLMLPHQEEKSYIYEWMTDVVRETQEHPRYRYDRGNEILLPDGKVLFTGGLYINIRVSCEIFDPVTEEWEKVGTLEKHRDAHCSVLLRPHPQMGYEQKVLVCGGRNENSCELFSPLNLSGEWEKVSSMEVDRKVSSLVMLPSGRVLIIGTETVRRDNRTCEIYTPWEDKWEMGDSLMWPRSHFGAVVLQTGKVLVMGGYDGSDYHNRCEIYDPMNPKWEEEGEGITLLTERRAHTVTPLPIFTTGINCSTNILIVGGENNSGVLKECELYNYLEHTIVYTEPLNTARAYHTATLLPSGNVLVVGGRGDGGGVISSCEEFDIRAIEWNNVGALREGRFDHTATLLADGRVLVTGGEGSSGVLSSCELYDNGSWAVVGSMNMSRKGHCAVLLKDGKVMVIGGETSTGVTNSCEIWDGSSWQEVEPMREGRMLHSAVVLQSGEVLVIGGKGNGGVALASCEKYDPVSNTWRREGKLPTGRYLHNTVLLYSGLVVVHGGYDGGNYLASTLIWDPAACWDTVLEVHQWKEGGSLKERRGYHSSCIIPTVKPLIYTLGGYDGSNYLNSIEIHDIGLEYLSLWQNRITNYPAITKVEDEMEIEGVLFRDYTEGDGGNYCHVVSSDHPLISLLRVGSGNWQGNGGGDLMYMPYSTEWNDGFTRVHPRELPEGWYRLWAIVNGIPTKWYEECATGIEERKRGKINSFIRVYPNPGYGEVVFECREKVRGRILIRIYDPTGRKVVERLYNQLGKERIRLRRGVYFYQVKIGTQEERGKIIILK